MAHADRQIEWFPGHKLNMPRPDESRQRIEERIEQLYQDLKFYYEEWKILKESYAYGLKDTEERPLELHMTRLQQLHHYLNQVRTTRGELMTLLMMCGRTV